jgi:hypothetical protein
MNHFIPETMRSYREGFRNPKIIWMLLEDSITQLNSYSKKKKKHTHTQS